MNQNLFDCSDKNFNLKFCRIRSHYVFQPKSCFGECILDIVISLDFSDYYRFRFDPIIPGHSLHDYRHENRISSDPFIIMDRLTFWGRSGHSEEYEINLDSKGRLLTERDII